MFSKLKQIIHDRAKGRCEYCKSPSDYSPQPFVKEHIKPKCKGGEDTLDNLAYACQGCNGHKHAKITGKDPVTEKDVPLYHPRQQEWNDNFEWSEDTLKMLGKTDVGRVTIQELKLNRTPVQKLRRLLKMDGEHPPKE